MARNIVLFSDGTGNSAASQFKTNVWRLYQALDLSKNDTLVKYDDGVGTETFKPLRMLGGAFGYGLARNVKELYAFLCRNYQEGDQIYGFGFSRGAFTIRILVGLVSKCGLIKAQSEQELQQKVDLAFIEYRRDFIFRVAEAKKWYGFFPYFPFVWRPYFLKPPRYQPHDPKDERPDPRRLALFEGQFWRDVTFLGLWDTVDAYGMPIDELKDGIDRWVWPLTVADRKLSSIVERARHALSLDEERPSFTPVLWTEEGSPRPPQPHPGEKAEPPARVKQVWFAGVHANVGGGYPNDDLALVTLDWMMQEASEAGLSFIPEERAAVAEHMNPHGRQYDSRAGVAAYYQYGPRSVLALCHDPAHGVEVTYPLIHRYVFERIAGDRVGYAPISLPPCYIVEEIPTANGKPYLLRWHDTFVSEPIPELGHSADRFSDNKLASDAVWRRRATYLVTVLTTAILVLFPAITCLSLWPEGLVKELGPIDRIVGPWIEWILKTAQNFAPGWSKPWLVAYGGQPTIFLVVGALLFWLFFFRSNTLHRTIDARSEWAWRRMKHPNISFEPPRASWMDTVARKLRKSRIAVTLYRFIARDVVPFIFAWMLAPALIPIVLVKLKYEDWKYRS